MTLTLIAVTQQEGNPVLLNVAAIAAVDIEERALGEAYVIYMLDQREIATETYPVGTLEARLDAVAVYI